MRAAGLRVPGGPGRHPLRGVRQAVQPGRGLRARHPLRPQPLHPLHPLRALHGGRGRDAGAQRLASAATAPTSASPRTSGSTIPGPATWWTSARSGRSSRRTSCTRRGPGTSTRRASVCPGCTQGCNISIDTRDDVVVRIRPRPNLEVNRHFICDYGRMNYRWMNRGDRIEAPLVREGGRHVATDWDTALDRLGQVVRGAIGLGGDPRLRAGLDRVAGPRAAAAGPVRGHRRGPGAAGRRGAARRDPEPGAPARAGAQPGRRRAAGLRRRLGGRRMRPGLGGRPGDRARRRSRPRPTRRPLAARAGHRGRARHGVADALRNAELVLPVTTMAEENGTYVNRDRRVQRYQQAKVAARHGAAGLVGGGRGARRVRARAPTRPRPRRRRSPCWASAGRCSPASRHADLGFTGRVLAEAPAARRRAGRRDDARAQGVPPAQRHQDAGGLHRHHGRRGAAHADGAQGQRLDAEPPRPQPGRLGRAAAAGRRRASRTSSRKRPSRRWPTAGSSCWRRRCRSSRRCCSRR